MQESTILYMEMLNKLKKEELTKIIDDYNKLAIIFDVEKIKIDKKDKKKDCLEKIDNIKENYFKYLIMLLDLDDYKKLKRMVSKKINEEFINDNEQLINYFISKNIIVKEDDLSILSDIKELLVKILKEKEVIKYIKNNTQNYKLINGIVNAYGILDIKSFIKIVGEDYKLEILDYYYKKEYSLDKDKIISDKLTNKTKITKYLNNKKIKEFTNEEYMMLGDFTYHKKIKAYKKLIKLFKKYYVFENKDVSFVDDEIIKPYIYDNTSDDAKIFKNIEIVLDEYFEFRDDLLKNKIMNEITKIKEEMPLWDTRGYNKLEVK